MPRNACLETIDVDFHLHIYVSLTYLRLHYLWVIITEFSVIIIYSVRPISPFSIASANQNMIHSSYSFSYATEQDAYGGQTKKAVLEDERRLQHEVSLLTPWST